MPCRELILQTSVGGSAQEMRKAQESGEQTSQAKRKQDSRRLPHAAERGASQRNQHRDDSALVSVSTWKRPNRCRFRKSTDRARCD